MNDQSSSEENIVDATISMDRANVVALLVIPLAVVAFLLPYGLLGGPLSFAGERPSLLIMVLAFVGGVVVHELLHAVGFILAGRVAVTAVKFGFSWQGLAPYAHCQEPMKASAYRLSVLLPGLLLGVVPGFLSLFLQSWPLVLWGILMTVTAGGDLAVLLAIRQVPGSAWVRDHPSKVGCQVLMEDNNE